MADAAIRLLGVVKNYGGLRPLRIADLAIAAGERVAVGGVDALAAEALVNLVTGAALPEEGRVEVEGRDTAGIADGDEWLASLDRFGIVSERAVLLENSTFLQNLALPITLEIDAISSDIKRRVEGLAAEAGLSLDRLAAQVSTASAEERTRAQLARALALDPAILLLEHPSARLPRDAAAPFGRDLAGVIDRRGMTAVAITEDAAFAKPFATRWVRVDGATGALKPARKKWLL
jgi:ABC-type lipoprotein export system ATPase subunit